MIKETIKVSFSLELIRIYEKKNEGFHFILLLLNQNFDIT